MHMFLCVSSKTGEGKRQVAKSETGSEKGNLGVLIRGLPVRSSGNYMHLGSQTHCTKWYIFRY